MQPSVNGPATFALLGRGVVAAGLGITWTLAELLAFSRRINVAFVLPSCW